MMLHDKPPTSEGSLDPCSNENQNSTAENVENKRISTNEYHEFHLCMGKKIRINKALLTFRLTLFLWYGGGIIPSTFFGIFLKQRGITLVQLSSVFSVIFLVQFGSSSIAGVIADKIGNAKPVFMFLMFSTFIVILSMLLTPNISRKSCEFQNVCSNTSDVLEYGKNFSSCYKDCLSKSVVLVTNDSNHDEKYINENLSVVEGVTQFEIGDRNTSTRIYDQLINISDNFSRNNCCNYCINNTEIDCVMVRNESLLIIYAIMILIFYSVYNITYRFLNFTAISLAEKNDSDFGKEYAFGKSADLLFIIITAFVLHTDKSSGSEINFDPVFWIALGIIFCAFLTSFTTTASILPPGKNLIKIAFKLMKDADTFPFILMAFLSGNGYAFYFAFHLMFLENMNASSTVVALHSVAIVLYGLIFLITSKWWIKKFGTNKMFVIGLLSRGINFVAFSCIQNPWWSLILDIFSAIADDLFWAAVVTHCWRVAPLGFGATYIALTGAVHHGMGRSSGVFFGGMIMNYLGLRIACRIMGAVCFATAILYSIFVYLRSKSARLLSK